MKRHFLLTERKNASLLLGKKEGKDHKGHIARKILGKTTHTRTELLKSLFSDSDLKFTLTSQNSPPHQLPGQLLKMEIAGRGPWIPSTKHVFRDSRGFGSGSQMFWVWRMVGEG
jgi:hypothetical protein